MWSTYLNPGALLGYGKGDSPGGGPWYPRAPGWGWKDGKWGNKPPWWACPNVGVMGWLVVVVVVRARCKLVEALVEPWLLGRWVVTVEKEEDVELKDEQTGQFSTRDNNTSWWVTNRYVRCLANWFIKLGLCLWNRLSTSLALSFEGNTAAPEIIYKVMRTDNDDCKNHICELPIHWGLTFFSGLIIFTTAQVVFITAKIALIFRADNIVSCRMPSWHNIKIMFWSH